MENKIRHHYVPAGLVKNFCFQDKRLYLYDTHDKRITPSAPRDVFVQKNLHAIITKDGSTDHNMVENEMMELEGNGLRVIKEIIAGEDITAEHRDWLSVFVALQQLRTPVYRKCIEELLKCELTATAKIMDAQGAFPELPAELKVFGSSLTELLENGIIKHEIILPQVTMQGMAALPAVHAALYQMNWSLIESEGANYFVLADHPCAILDPDLKKHGMGLGVTSNSIEITLPIGKNHCLMASWKNIPKILQASPAQVTNINARSAIFGERFFVYPIETQDTLDHLLKYRDCSFANQVSLIPTSSGQCVVGQNNIVGPDAIKLYDAITPLF